MDKNSFESYENKIREEFENSTIFNSDFQEAPKHKKNKKHSSYTKLLCCLLCLLIIIGTSIFAIVKYWPAEENTITEQEPSSNSIALTSQANVDLSELKNADKDAVCNVKKIIINNKTDKFECVPYTVTETDDEGNKTEEIYFKLKGVDEDIPIDNSLVTLFYEQIFDVSAVSKLDSKWTDKDCGLDKPEINVLVTMADNSDFSFSIGNESPDGNYYLKTSLKEGIYVVDSSVYDNFSVNINSLVNKTVLYSITENDSNSYYFLNGQLSAFDSITLKGKNFENETKLSYNNTSDEVLLYYIDEPVKTYADEDKIKTLLTPLSSGLDAAYAYELKPSDKDYQKYGLNSPYMELSYKIDNKNYILKFSEPDYIETGYTACVVEGVPVIYAVSNDSVSFVEWKLNDLRYNLLYLRNIETIKTMTVSYSGKTYKYELSFDKPKTEKADTDSTESTTAADKVLTVIINSSPIDSDNFRTMYQRLALVSAADYLGENIKLSEKPYLTLEIELNNGKKDIITYTKYDTNYYLYQINGIGDELIQAQTVELLKVNYEKLRKGEEVISPNNQQ